MLERLFSYYSVNCYFVHFFGWGLSAGYVSIHAPERGSDTYSDWYNFRNHMAVPKPRGSKFSLILLSKDSVSKLLYS